MKKRIYNHIKKNPTLGKYHIDYLANNYEKYEQEFNKYKKILDNSDNQNSQEAIKIKDYLGKIQNQLKKMEEVSDKQAYAILFNYYLDTKNDKYNIHVNSGLEKEITELQQAYYDNMNIETSEGIEIGNIMIEMANDVFSDEGITFGGGKKKRKKNKSKKKQKK